MIQEKEEIYICLIIKKEIVDYVLNIPKQPAPNISRGRIKDKNKSWGYFVEPTPNKENTGKVSDILLPNPLFTIEGGIYKESIDLSFSLPKNLPDGISLSDIFYTIDNSEPTVNSKRYSPEKVINIMESTVIKAKFIHSDFLINRSQTHSYIIMDRDFSLPVVSISTNKEYLWDDEFGIYVKGNGKYGQIGRGSEVPVNWNNNWRRPVNFEYFPHHGEGAVINQLGEFRVGGGWSRVLPLKTFILYANKRFGDKKRYDYDFFERKPGMEVKSFMLRNAGSDFGLASLRDPIGQLLVGNKMDIDYQEIQPTIVFLNGSYWGIMFIRERSNEDFVLSNYSNEDVDVIENWRELKAGNNSDYWKMIEDIQKNKLSYNDLKNLIDINEYINYMIIQILVANTDFPQGNVSMWKPQTDGGKWRFILKDVDQGLGWGGKSADFNALEYNAHPKDKSNIPFLLFPYLLESEEFREEFSKRFSIYLGDIFQYKYMLETVDSLSDLIALEYPYHIAQWNNQTGRKMERWEEELNMIKTWLSERNGHVYEHLKDFFHLSSLVPLKIESLLSKNFEKNEVEVFMEDIKLYSPSFDGKYYVNKPLTVKVNSSNNSNLCWMIHYNMGGQKYQQSIQEAQQDLIVNIPKDCQNVLLQLQYRDKNSIFNPNINIHENILTINNLSQPSKIFIYSIDGRLIYNRDTYLTSTICKLPKRGIYIVQIKSSEHTFTQKIIY